MTAPEEWRRWGESLPSTLSNEERYTATLILTLERLSRTFGHPWGLTGGTCLQSYLDPKLRRYSMDLEIITPATEEEVLAWMGSQGFPGEKMNERAVKCLLTPEGTLFVIHSYPTGDFEAANIQTRTFEHFPISTPPPGAVEARLISPPYLIATKLWEVQKLGRGGERPKDAYDLARCIGIVDVREVMQKLEVYARHQGKEGQARDIARRAACYLEWYGGPGFASFERWSTKFVPADSLQVSREDLVRAAMAIEKVLGEKARLSPREQCELIIRNLTPKQLVPIAKKLGMDEKRLGQYENVRDFVLEQTLDKLPEPVATTAEGLHLALRTIAGL